MNDKQKRALKELAGEAFVAAATAAVGVITAAARSEAEQRAKKWMDDFVGKGPVLEAEFKEQATESEAPPTETEGEDEDKQNR